MTGDEIALIMAGGEGSRMARTHPHLPKALIEVGGVPLIVITLERLRAIGVADVWVSLHHRAQEIIHTLRGRPDLDGLRLEFIVEEEPLGTIGALAELDGIGRTVLVQNGDLLSGIDLAAMRAMHHERDADLTIATHDEHHRLKLGEVITDDRGTVVEYREKPVKRFRISSGTYLVSSACLSLCTPCVFTSFPDFVNLAVREGRRVVDHHHDAAWIDVNDDADLARAERILQADRAAFLPHRLAEGGG
jgi:NDP-sugar pyrophosphorylase family protein